MSGSSYNQKMTEAVGVFHDTKQLQAAVDELLTSGFDHAELSVLAHTPSVSQYLADRKASVADFEDDPSAPRTSYVADESYGDAEGGIMAACIYLAAIAAIFVVGSAGGSTMAMLAAAVVAGAAGLVVGLFLAGMSWRRRMQGFDEHLKKGGALLWVRTHDARHERRALRILEKHSADDVHLHKIPRPQRLMSGIPTRRPAIWFGGAPG